MKNYCYVITEIDTVGKLKVINKVYGTKLRKVPVNVTILNGEFIKRSDYHIDKDIDTITYEKWHVRLNWKVKPSTGDPLIDALLEPPDPKVIIGGFIVIFVLFVLYIVIWTYIDNHQEDQFDKCIQQTELNIGEAKWKEMDWYKQRSEISHCFRR